LENLLWRRPQTNNELSFFSAVTKLDTSGTIRCSFIHTLSSIIGSRLSATRFVSDTLHAYCVDFSSCIAFTQWQNYQLSTLMANVARFRAFTSHLIPLCALLNYPFLTEQQLQSTRTVAYSPTTPYRPSVILGPLWGHIAVPSVTRCRCCCHRRRGHRCAGGMRQCGVRQ